MTLQLEDRELVIACQAGDDDAFAALVRAYQPQLYGHAIRRLQCRDAAEDAVQETLVRALRAMPRFNGDYMVGPWLHRILANVCIDEGNRRRRESEKNERAAVRDTRLLRAPSAEDELGLDIDHTQVAEAVEGLSKSYREALLMRVVEELPYNEIATAAGVSEDNARARVSRARTALRSALRGAALLPLGLVALLRRGERAASAMEWRRAGVEVGRSVLGSASSSTQQFGSSLPSSMSLFADTAPYATQTASAAAQTAVASAAVGMPVVAKAAVGFGLAASVVAPSVDSPLHRAANQLLPSAVMEYVAPFPSEPVPADAPVYLQALVHRSPATQTQRTASDDAASTSAALQTQAAVVAADAPDADAADVVSGPEAADAGSALESESESDPAADPAAAPIVSDAESPGDNPAAAPASAEVGVGRVDGTGTQAGATVTGSMQPSESSAAAGSAAADVSRRPVTQIAVVSSAAGVTLAFAPSGADRYDVSGELLMTVTTTTSVVGAHGDENGPALDAPSDQAAPAVQTTSETQTTSTVKVAVLAPSTAQLSAADPASADGTRRFSALLVFAPDSDGHAAELRLAARGAAVSDGRLSMSGVFTAASAGSLPLAGRGTLSGALHLDADGTPQSLTVTLTPEPAEDGLR